MGLTHDRSARVRLERRARTASPVPFGAGRGTGRVVAEHRDLYRVQTAFGDVSARITGRLRYQPGNRRDLPTVGDWVLLDAGEPDGVAVLREVLPRRSRFSRKVAGERTEEQIVAANIDVVWVASALDQPLSLRRIERYLALAWESGAMPVTLLTRTLVAFAAEWLDEQIAHMIIDPAGLERLCASNDIVRPRIFGSVARGTATPARGADLLVEFTGPKSLLDLVGIEQEFEDLLRRQVDLLAPAALSPYLREQVLCEARVLYERRAA